MTSRADPGQGFFTSSYSAVNCNCVEVKLARADGLVAVRDSKSPAGPVLTFSHRAWGDFVADIRDGRFDRG